MKPVLSGDIQVAPPGQVVFSFSPIAIVPLNEKYKNEMLC